MPRPTPIIRSPTELHLDADPCLALRDEERTRCEIWTRVMGYHRPVSAWNAGKQAEHQERRYFREHGPF